MQDNQLDRPLLSRRGRWILYGVAWTIGLVVMAWIVAGPPNHTPIAQAQTDNRQAAPAQPPAPQPVDANRLGTPSSTYGTSGEGSTAGSPGTTGESTSGNSGRPVEPSVDSRPDKTK